MNSLAIQYERLKRHYDAAARTYDHISFLDLAHTLRVWSDLTQNIESVAPGLSKSTAFRTVSPSRHAQRTLRDRVFVYSLLPSSVVTYASQGVITGLRKQDEQPANAEVIAKFRHNEEKLEVAFYAYISPSFDAPVAEIFHGQGVKRCTFKQWMNSLSVVGSLRTKEGDLKSFTLTREQLIRRVANELDASHPKGSEVPPRAVEASRATHYLLEHLVAGLPLPYFHLLKDAQDIVEVGQTYFSQDNP
jgi:hypothetical protein